MLREMPLPETSRRGKTVAVRQSCVMQPASVGNPGRTGREIADCARGGFHTGCNSALKTRQALIIRLDKDVT